MSYLLEPLLGGRLVLKNRLVMPPMATRKANEDGSLGEAIFDYYDEKTRGGAIGLVIIEHCYVMEQGRYRKAQPSVANDDAVEGLAKLAGIIHRNGSKTVLQINHAGGAASAEVTGMEVVAPSTVASAIGSGDAIPRALTRAEIRDIVGRFRAAARRAKAAGFDGVEIHSAHGYLLNQFYSPLTNTRTDEYGGDVLGRIRVHLEVIEAVRDEVGDAYPVLLRLGACDYREGGSTVEDATVAAAEFEKAGVDVLDITGGLSSYTRPPGHPEDEQGYFGDVTAAVKSVVSTPVILTGGITDASAAERLLAEGKADLIGVGRAILRDSGWAERAVRSLEG